jgi:outer membrane protein TolC
MKEASKLTDLNLDDYSMRQITLLDAVRMTMANSPTIHLAVQDVVQAQASLLGIQGAFDHNLNLNYEYANKVSENRDAEKMRERARYQTIRDLYKTANIVLERIDAVKSGKLAPEDFGTEGTPLDDPTSALNGGLDPDLSADDKAISELEKVRDAELNALVAILQGGLNIPDAGKAQELAAAAVEAQRDIFIRMRDGARRSLIKEPPWIVTRTETQRYELSILRRFRGGASIKLFANANGRETNFTARSNDPRENRSAVGLQVTINLSKLGLADPNFAQERAFMQDLSAKKEIARDRAASQVLLTVQSYWQLAAAQERLERLYLSELETMASTIVAQKMIEGKLLPAMEKSQIEARQLQAVANRMSAEIELATAQQALAIAMGVDPTEVYAAPLAADPLPPLSDAQDLQRTGAPLLVEHTLSYHPNLIAFRYLLNATLILQDQARRDLRPDLRLNVGGDFSGYNQNTGLDGTFGVWGSNQTGPSFFVAGSLDWPFENRARRGSFLAAESSVHRTRLQEDAARRQLASNVSQAYNKVMIASRQGRQFALATKRFADGLELERQKLQGGTGTAVDIIFAEQNLTNGLLQEISSRFLHATSLAELRYNTFTILPPFEFSRLENDPARIRVTDDYFTTMPTRMVLSQYRGSAPSVATATGRAAATQSSLGVPKPQPLLTRIFGADDEDDGEDSKGDDDFDPPSTGELLRRRVKEAPAPISRVEAPDVPTSPAETAPAPRGKKEVQSARVDRESSAPMSAEPVTTPPAPPKSDKPTTSGTSSSPDKPRPLLKRIFSRD